MTPTPTGRFAATPHGHDLILTRTFHAPIEDVWASITESERTARWFASWTGEPRVGGTVSVQLTMEGDIPPSEMTIDACEPPRHLAVTTSDEAGRWSLEAQLSQDGDTTELIFIHHLDSSASPGEVGPGWEYYLDRLVASRDDTAAPQWDDYYPAQKAYYEAL